MEDKKKEPSDPSKENESEKKRSSTSVGSPLLVVLEFLEALSNVASDSRILINADAGTVGGATVKYCLLAPASQFSELVRECRSVVVAGGTMQPVAEFEEQLFARGGADRDRIVSFSCGHVVPKENLMPVVLAKVSSGSSKLAVMPAEFGAV